jgi:hypothetical protein
MIRTTEAFHLQATNSSSLETGAWFTIRYCRWRVKLSHYVQARRMRSHILSVVR